VVKIVQEIRIGGEFEIDISSLDAKENTSVLPYPNHFKIWLDTGRSAIHLALEDIKKRSPSRAALLPAFICPTVVEPFLKLGFSVNYYSESSLMDLCVKDNQTIFFANYFGTRNGQAIDWINKLRADSQIFVIEDCVQSSLNTNVGETGDYVVTSLRKFLPQPDGALLASVQEVKNSAIFEPNEQFISNKFLGKVMRHTADRNEDFLTFLENSEKMLISGFPREMSALSKFMMNHTDIRSIQTIRRNNWFALHHGLSEAGLLKFLQPVFNDLASGEVPIGFPVIVGNGQRDRLREFLSEKSIYCPIHWKLSHLDRKDEEFSEEIALSQAILTFPIDQRLSSLHIEYLLASLSDFYD